MPGLISIWVSLSGLREMRSRHYGDFDKAIGKDPDFVDAIYGRGLIYLHKKKVRPGLRGHEQGIAN